MQREGNLARKLAILKKTASFGLYIEQDSHARRKSASPIGRGRGKSLGRFRAAGSVGVVFQWDMRLCALGTVEVWRTFDLIVSNHIVWAWKKSDRRSRFGGENDGEGGVGMNANSRACQ